MLRAQVAKDAKEAKGSKVAPDLPLWTSQSDAVAFSYFRMGCAHENCGSKCDFQDCLCKQSWGQPQRYHKAPEPKEPFGQTQGGIVMSHG